MLQPLAADGRAGCVARIRVIARRAVLRRLRWCDTLYVTATAAFWALELQ